MCCKEQKVFWIVLGSVLLAVVATVIALTIARGCEKRLLQKEFDEKDSDIKECGC
jgi:hypothetical protein